ncbi:Protein kinase superfamily protein [Zostera marina]|uniref:Protein kinase superfamily protein n=1 Tax=Zostera marina TaxID=29655 RepID=A0A0K9PNN5_ZOSMR|nr:Protein kinase superfamily protein [Zostera marina]
MAMEGGEFVRADKIDLKSLDKQLERHLNRVWSMKKKIQMAGADVKKRSREEWEIDPLDIIIKDVIAHGTFGTVHRGVYCGQDVAVKLLDWGDDDANDSNINALRSTFNQEVAVWHNLDHPNVTKFIGATMGTKKFNLYRGKYGNLDNVCCVVLEYLDGGTLKTFLLRNSFKQLAFKVVMQLALDLARGLSYLHSKNIVHRDVKTENMLLDKKRKLKITDFGVARVVAQNPKDMTRETGTLGYMAPEVLRGDPYDIKCDVYSFGICLWEIYCCDMPYSDLSISQVISGIASKNLRPEIPWYCPTSLANVMMRCWNENANRRPEMYQVVQMLEAIDVSKGRVKNYNDKYPPSCFCFRFRSP